MKRQILTTLVLLNFSFAMSAEEHSHHESAAGQEIKLNNGKKWSTDKPLRESMEKINSLVKSNLSAVHNGKQSDEEFAKLAQLIKEQTDLIFKNCKLTPDADKELHKILVPILNAQSVFASKESKEKKHDSFVAIIKSLDSYSRHFDHKNW